MTVSGRGGDVVISRDEQPFKAKLDKIAGLRPAFVKDGTITAATSSSISDGAAAMLLMLESRAAKLGLQPVARIHGHAVHAQAPEWFATAPAGAIAKLLARNGWDVGNVDLWEVNEAFASVVLGWQRELGVDLDKVNVLGGAIALGHPVGASGGRLMANLLRVLAQTGGRYGLQTMCESGGMANATLIERL